MNTAILRAFRGADILAYMLDFSSLPAFIAGRSEACDKILPVAGIHKSLGVRPGTARAKCAISPRLAVAGRSKVLDYSDVEWAMEESKMMLLVVYLALMITGNFVAYGIGLVIENNMPAASLPAFLALYFFNLGICWFIAVKLTKPKSKTA